MIWLRALVGLGSAGGLLSPREPTNQSPVSRTQFQNTNQQNRKYKTLTSLLDPFHYYLSTYNTPLSGKLSTQVVQN